MCTLTEIRSAHYLCIFSHASLFFSVLVLSISFTSFFFVGELPHYANALILYITIIESMLVWVSVTKVLYCFCGDLGAYYHAKIACNFLFFVLSTYVGGHQKKKAKGESRSIQNKGRNIKIHKSFSLMCGLLSTHIDPCA